MRVIDISWRRYVFPPFMRKAHAFSLFRRCRAFFLFWVGGEELGILGLGATIWCFFFFRDPVRFVPTRPGLMVSPASGLVQMIGEVVPPKDLGLGEQPLTRISIFMSVFDCHVNRIPCFGEVTSVVYRPGLFVNATLDKASEDNERNSIRIRLDDGREYGVVQIAGLLARRIRCDVFEGQKCRTGERLGLIWFGSRVDVYLPREVHPLVVPGQVCVSGETILADVESQETARSAEEI